MSEKVNTQEGDKRTSEQSPGTLLRSAREKMKLSQVDVAERLNLTLKWVQGIETDEYRDMKSLTYVRGYLQAYARLVGVSPATVLEAFNQADFTRHFTHHNQKSTKIFQEQVKSVAMMQKKTKRYLGRWLTASLLVLLVILLVFAWQKQHQRSAGYIQSSQAKIILTPSKAKRKE